MKRWSTTTRSCSRLISNGSLTLIQNRTGLPGSQLIAGSSLIGSNAALARLPASVSTPKARGARKRFIVQTPTIDWRSAGSSASEAYVGAYSVVSRNVRAVGEVRRANLATRRLVPSRIAVDRDLRAGLEALGRQAVARQHAARRHLAAPGLRVARGVDDVDVEKRVRIDEVELRDDAFEVDGLRGVVVRRDAVMRETRRRQDESQ